MKKLLVALMLLGASATVQSQEKGSLEFGITVGYNAATVTAGSNTNSDYRSGFNVTAFGDYFFSDRWSIKTKLAYDQKGWNNGFLTNLDNGQSYATDYQLNYLTIPVMANWHFGKKRNWFLNFGPYAGILLDAKETTFGMDLKDYMKTADVGLGLGIGVKIPVASRLKILIETEGQAGFIDVFKDNTGSEIRNSRSSINAGLVFAL
ncbi:porin family protein [Pedobacter sp. GR22-6]|uniref:porin family protein n=1 Tax=Pedobacter sp. GR22-6 TaxID=3127957 RepID=UPI00307E73A0